LASQSCRGWDEGIGLSQASGSYSFKNMSFLCLVSGRCDQHAAGECVQFLSAGKLQWTWSSDHDGTTVLLLENTHCHLYFRGWHRGFNCLLRKHASSHFGGSSFSVCLLLSLFHALGFFGQDNVIIEYDLVGKVKIVFCCSQFLQLVHLDIVGFVHPS